jgi:hypothetical protein
LEANMPLLPFSDASLPTTDASQLTTGTLADARLSSNVPLKNATNTFSVGQTITNGTANTAALTASYSVTGSSTTPLLDLSGTWNTSGLATGLKLNITDTASASSSLLMDLQVGGTSQMSVSKGGVINLGTSATYKARLVAFSNNSGISAFTNNINLISGNVTGLSVNSSGNTLVNSILGFGTDASPGVVADTYLYRDAANTLAQRNGTNAQTTRIYGTYTDSSNARWLNISNTTGGLVTLTSTGNGTGASGNLLKLTAPILLPASSVTLATNGDLAFEATSNTVLTIRYRGSDGTTRSATIALV